MLNSGVTFVIPPTPMVFSSVIFVFYFLPIFLIFYYLTGIKNATLLIGSAIFYVWGEGPYVFLLFALVAANQGAAILIGGSSRESRPYLLAGSIIANLLVLGVFKYSQFILNIIAGIAGKPPLHLDIDLPLGISFFTFQLVSYLIEVSRGHIAPERNFVRLATYVMMFPHLVAGPIVRYTDIVDELKNRHVGTERIGLGLQYFIIGLCQKALIANTVASVADNVYSLPISQVTTLMAWAGAFSYTLQIYFDFCGYSNMAIGLAFLLGFRFPRNFNYPYASRSVREFWQRWHMTLSFWFRDYLYLPLGGNRGGKWKTLRNLLIVFFVTGLWHGAAWTFICWGMFHGAFLVVERTGFNKVLERSPMVVSRAYTLFVVMVGWVFFRSNDLPQAMVMLKAMAGFGAQEVWPPIQAWLSPEVLAAMAAGCVFSLPVLPWMLDKLGCERVNGSFAVSTMDRDTYSVHPLPSTLLLLGFLISVISLVSGTLNPFLYFRF